MDEGKALVGKEWKREGERYGWEGGREKSGKERVSRSSRHWPTQFSISVWLNREWSRALARQRDIPGRRWRTRESSRARDSLEQTRFTAYAYICMYEYIYTNACCSCAWACIVVCNIPRPFIPYTLCGRATARSSEMWKDIASEKDSERKRSTPENFRISLYFPQHRPIALLRHCIQIK